MTISFYKGLTGNSEIANTPVWVLSNIWRLGRVRNAKFGTNVSSKMLLKAAKCQGYSFYRCRVNKRKPTGVGGGGQGATGLNSCHFLMTLKVVQHKEFFFFGKLWKLNWGFIYLDICILPWIEVLSTWIFAFYHRYWDKMQGKKAFQSS